jgi:hypothetical protein
MRWEQAIVYAVGALMIIGVAASARAQGADARREAARDRAVVSAADSSV